MLKKLILAALILIGFFLLFLPKKVKAQQCPWCPWGTWCPYMACEGTACVNQYYGCGTNSCTGQSDCGGCGWGEIDPHNECIGGTCRSVSGCGTQGCLNDSNCTGTPQDPNCSYGEYKPHNVCGGTGICYSENSCGTDECQTDNNCGAPPPTIPPVPTEPPPQPTNTPQPTPTSIQQTCACRETNPGIYTCSSGCVFAGYGCYGPGASCGGSIPAATSTPVPTATATLVPTATPTPAGFGCNTNCAYSAQCASGYCWPNTGTCRNSGCPAELDCDCAIGPTATVTPTPLPTFPPRGCGQSCGDYPNCRTGLICYSTGAEIDGFVCRNPDCPEETDCNCPSTPSCPSSCSGSGDCAAICPVCDFFSGCKSLVIPTSTGGPTPTGGATPTPGPTGTPTPTPLPSAWYQTKEGDVHGNTGVSSKVPSAPVLQVFSKDGENPLGVPGVISSGNSDLSVGKVSSQEWQVEDELISDFGGKTYDYNYFYQLLGSPTTDNFNGNLSEITNDGAYYSNDDVKIDNDWNFPSGRKATILVKANLEINKKILVPVGSFLAFIVKGNINIKGTVGEKVGTAGENDPDIEGIYLADGTIDTNYDNDQSGFRLVAAGTFISQTGFALNRDLKTDNITAPAEYFIFRPDFWLFAPRELQKPSYNWQEIAP